jgi:serine/threonine protein kinase
MSGDVQLFSKDCSSAEAAAREARHLEALRGPGIVPLLDAGTNGPTLEKAACSLADVLRERGLLPASEVRAVGAATAAALARMHASGLVHGDIKPANLLLSPNRELWLADFDAACPADGRPLERFSPGRLPPGAPALPAIDVAALGLALVELATGAILDPGATWRPADLRRLGCSPSLSAELSFMLDGFRLDGDGRTLSARDAAKMLGRGDFGSLPAPAAEARRFDPTPTAEFMLACHPQPDTSARPALKADEPASRWWQRLAASWRPGGPDPRSGSPSPVQASGSSQASRSS